MDAKFVVIIPECLQISRQVDCVPEEQPIKILAANSADQPFDERMRHRDIWDRLDFSDVEDAQVGELAVEAEQWVVIGADAHGASLASNGLIEHPAHGHAVDVLASDSKTDDSTGD